MVFAKRQQQAPRHMLVLGGCRSGKSRFAEQWVAERFEEKVFVATLERRDDDEMNQRIALHRKTRDPGWLTVEEPVEIAAVLLARQGEARVFLVDCLTMWLTNMLLRDYSAAVIEKEVQALQKVVRDLPASVVLVANEVGLGIVPESPLARRFRDFAGWLNQQMALTCDRVVFVAAGLPIPLKGQLS